MSAELEVSYNNACASASAKVGREEKSKSSSGSENLEVEITAIGHEIGSKITADNLAEAIQLHRNFAIMSNGTGLTLLL
jgi:ribosomal 50S subunit-recycling heat shock protein